MNVWELIKKSVASRLSSESFQNWFAQTSLREFEYDTAWVSVPNEAAREYIEQRYSELIQSIIRELSLPVRHIVFETPAGSAHDKKLSEDLPVIEPEALFEAPATHLNPRFTFDNFVVGSCNQFAHAAAQAVATKPSQRYNPLFIYGGVGMGKTHLMHAIGRSLLENYASMRIVYTSSERFMNEMITSIRLQRMPLFHRHYRSADVLLVDDIQVLGRKEGTQEEFFYTFNELYEHQKQIVISSDSPPKEIPGLVDRLRSRFEWGLMVDIQAPDVETKMAILDKKAEMEGIRLPEDVRVLIATKTKSNVRELEGALVKLVAYSSVTGLPINLSMAQYILKHIIHNGERKVTIDAVIRAVAAKCNLQPAQLKLKSNRREIARPRQIAMYVAKELTRASLPEIGRAFGGKHHTTVLHSIHRIEELRQSDPDLNRLIQSVSDSLG
ncbi:MAG: chromosomal replication initiator protein DnaA [Bryobacteraceae bacterium]|jgi:chromosomal replication initiator protein